MPHCYQGIFLLGRKQEGRREGGHRPKDRGIVADSQMVMVWRLYEFHLQSTNKVSRLIKTVVK
jgi:hypothetical protein